MPEPLLSVVIPVGPEEPDIPQGLIEDLHLLPEGSEIILVGCDPIEQAVLKEQTDQVMNAYPVYWLFTAPDRGIQMNTGAAHASGQFIWFLHLDSRFSPALIDALLANLSRYPNSLHYCLLEFMSDGPSSMPLNSLGANLRSLLLGVPFGDQGFLIKKEKFNLVGGYPESVAYGEDHLFVWYARQNRVPLKCCWQKLRTSARKYERKGWLSLTLLYQRLWIKQAWPEFIRLLRTRYF
ncbi:hypothetical protein [uncultured Neptuniibacter sp.]|uniref:hypothetical protein n=1 Tax=uncultured Neptuniibacter sp. TaxID=502143 RepID=UPI002620D72C|nr:hypothetical protein [uncultured Neptuniibacter sp.]